MEETVTVGLRKANHRSARLWSGAIASAFRHFREGPSIAESARALSSGVVGEIRSSVEFFLIGGILDLRTLAVMT